MPAAQYYIVVNGAPVGPMSLADLEARIKAGTVTATTQVWKVGSPSVWVAASSLPELAGQFSAAAPPPVDLNAQFRNFIVGAWEIDGIDTQQNMLTRMILQFSANGDFFGAEAQLPRSNPYGQPTIIQTNGTWSIRAIDSQHFTLTLAPTNGSPSTLTIAVIDQNDIRDEGENLVARRIRQ